MIRCCLGNSRGCRPSEVDNSIDLKPDLPQVGLLLPPASCEQTFSIFKLQLEDKSSSCALISLLDKG